jgi:6-phosphogluconolactonase
VLRVRAVPHILSAWLSVNNKSQFGIPIGVPQRARINLAVCCALLLSVYACVAKTEWAFVASPVKGIYSYKIDTETAAVLEAGPAADFPRASFMAVHPNGHFLYAVAEGSRHDDSLVAAFSIEAESGKLKLLNEMPSGGHGPCHLCVNPTGEAVMVANYNSGSIAAFPIKKSGVLEVMSALIQDKGSSVNHERQEGPHAHCVISGPKSQWALACDLGLDKVLVFRLNPSDSSLVPNQPPSVALKPGAGPRHIALHPNNHFAYVINELDSTLTVFSWDSKSGTLNQLQNVSTLPKDFDGKNFPAEVAVHPNGKFVYGSNRGHDSIAIFGVDQKNGKLELVGHHPSGGKCPRHFEIDPTGKLMLVANQDSDKTVVYRIDPKTGALAETDTSFALPQPMCVKCVEVR